MPHGGTHPLLSNKEVYKTLIRIHPSGDKMAKAFTNLFRTYGWSRAAFITSYGFCDLAGPPIIEALKEMGVFITEWIRSEKTAADYLLRQYLDQVKERARIIITCLDDRASFMKLLRLAYDLGMRAPDYVFMRYGNVPSERTLSPWTQFENITSEQVEEWKRVLISINFKQVSMAGLKGEKFERFYDRIPIRFAQEPWSWDLPLQMGWRGSQKSVDVYDMTTAYLTVVNESIAEGSNFRDGRLIQNKLRNKVIYGMRGKILFDENADREPDYWFLDLAPGDDMYKEVVLISVAEPPDKRFNVLDNRSIYWGTPDGNPPPDTPACGFQNELCQDDSGEMTIIIGCSVGGGVFLLFILVTLLLYRRHQEEQLLKQMLWKINFEEVKVGKKRAGSVANMSQRSIRSEGSRGSAGDGHEGVRQMFTEVGEYRGNTVAILRVLKTAVQLTRMDLRELKAMKDMSHENLAVFVGACIDPPNICYFMQYYTKGSVLDIIENEEVQLDWMFKTSLLSDLANGMAYIHKSEIGSHGSLKSSCCLVDSRWQLKISSYGLHALRSGQSDTDVGDYEKYRKLLWTAPELLRMPDVSRPRYGTPRADVYSYGVIVQEIIYRTMPYFIDMESPKEIVTRLARGTPEKHYRPELPKADDETNPGAIELIRQCWMEDPAARPSFDVIIKRIQGLNKGKKIDIMSTIMQKLERYANNLEGIVNQRTAELLIEKKKTDELLYKMLPELVAERLKQGQTVEAELFDEVTIYFSDIVGFTALSLESSPLEVVDLLNDLYTMFDDIINLHDVYKVETISDSYMVVSGLPRRNGNRHVAEIANLALDLMSAAVTNFRIRHRPGMKLQLRIGFHTGPCAAGVVGLSMPRYCLFGDTVNMSSRMETNGKALNIHMSKFAFAALEKIGGYFIKPRGEMQIKGKGLQMTYWLHGKEGYDKPLPSFE